MTELCVHCHQRVETTYEFCSHCGKPLDHVALAEHRDPEKVPVSGAFGGLYLGLVVAPVMVIVGTMLCLTGLGAILGVPMIIGGILSPLAGPLFGMSAIHPGSKPTS